MANTFKNARLAVTSSNQTMYTNSSGGTALILTLRITNVDGATDDTVTAQIYDNSASAATKVASTITVPADSSIELAGTSKLVLEKFEHKFQLVNHWHKQHSNQEIMYEVCQWCSELFTSPDSCKTVSI